MGTYHFGGLRCVGLLTILSAGCASNSGVVPLGNDQYILSRQAATGFGGQASLKADVIRDASAYCAQLGQTFAMLDVQEARPPFVLGNYPRVELTFRCEAR